MLFVFAQQKFSGFIGDGQGPGRALSSAEKDERFGSEMLLKLRSTEPEAGQHSGQEEDQTTRANITMDMGAEHV